MAVSGYHRMARLGTHPAFRMSLACLACPLCDETFERVPAYTKHFTAHGPSRDEAWQWLDAKSFKRYETTLEADAREWRRVCWRALFCEADRGQPWARLVMAEARAAGIVPDGVEHA